MVSADDAPMGEEIIPPPGGDPSVQGVPDCTMGQGGVEVWDWDFALDARPQPVLVDFEIVSSLQIHPKGRRSSKVPGQPEGRIGGNGACSMDDFVDPASGDPGILG